MTQEKELLTVEELAAKFKCCTATIRNYRREGMPSASDTPLRFHYDVCLDWLQQRKRKGAK